MDRGPLASSGRRVRRERAHRSRPPLLEAPLPTPNPQAGDHDCVAAPASASGDAVSRPPDALAAAIIAISADAIISIDASHRIILFNQGAEHIFGYSPSEVLGRQLDMLIPEHFRGVHDRDVERFGEGPVAARRMGERGEIVGRRKSGEVFPAEASISKIDADGQRIYTVVLRDISVRKRAEAERAQLLEREHAARTAAEAAEQRATFLADSGALLDRSLDYVTTLQSLADLVVPRLADVCIIDVVEDGGTVHRVASAAGETTLRETAQALHAFPRRADEPYLTREALESGRPVLVREVTPAGLAMVTQHPEHLRLLLALQPRSYMAVPLVTRGRTLGAMAFIVSREGRNYTSADMAFADALARRAALAIDNARLYGAAQRATSARDEILGVVSHDLRNPLSAILMCASALKESLPSSDESIRYLLDTVEQSAEWMNRLIQDLLDIASIETGHLAIERKPEPVAPLLAQIEKLFAASAGDARISLVIDSAADVPPVLADRERILQVLANLVANARRFTPAGGTIHVHAELDPADARFVRFSVRDTGCGILPEHLPHLFDRFWQARRGAKERGTGLGLAISKGIVEAHGGTIGVESAPGTGSTFAFVIPTVAGAKAGR
ncbi:MAG TPA: ATP-binding protein [Gemmatimonadaceae bacterium]|nr:ATP-binding protein [Gemmatimonadaceae bacterium]